MNRYVLSAATFFVVLSLLVTTGALAEKTITVMTHDSFDVSKNVVAAFEKENQEMPGQPLFRRFFLKTILSPMYFTGSTTVFYHALSQRISFARTTLHC